MQLREAVLPILEELLCDFVISRGCSWSLYPFLARTGAELVEACMTTSLQADSGSLCGDGDEGRKEVGQSIDRLRGCLTSIPAS